MSWEVSKVYVSLSRDAIKNAPEYHPDTLNREYEEKLDHHSPSSEVLGSSFCWPEKRLRRFPGVKGADRRKE